MSSTPSTVSFSHYDEAYEVLHISDYSCKELAACWYSHNIQDLEESKAEITATIQAMERCGSSTAHMIDDDRIFCTRGLESKTQQGRSRSERLVGGVWNAVLDEQFQQWDRKICNPEAIAVACSENSKVSIALARMTGIADERVAQNILSRRSITDPPSSLKMQRGSSNILQSHTDADTTATMVTVSSSPISRQQSQSFQSRPITIVSSRAA